MGCLRLGDSPFFYALSAAAKIISCNFAIKDSFFIIMCVLVILI